MQYQIEVLRFKEGVRSRHPSPDATVAAARPGALSDAGDQLAVMVDLVPELPYRSREIRTLVVKTYWNSSGSVVARLRRALVAANRHLISFNRKAASGNKCAGNITCAVFSDGELFLGQVGAAYAYVKHPTATPTVDPGDASFEVFPKRDRLLVPLGGTVPPVINVGYTVMVPGSVACLATTRAAEALAREAWLETLALTKLNAITSALTKDFTTRKVSGSLILFRAQASAEPAPKPWSRPLRSSDKTSEVPAEPTGDRTPAAETHAAEAPSSGASTTKASPPEQTHRAVAASLTPIPKTHSRAGSKPTASDTKQDVASPSSQDTTRATYSPRPKSGEPVKAPPADGEPRAVEQQAPAAEPEMRAESRSASRPKRPRPEVQISLPPIGDWISNLRERWQMRREIRKSVVKERTTTAERARLRQALRTLLPGKIEGRTTSTAKTPPDERTTVMGGLTLGFLAVVTIITLTMYFQYGGPLKAEELLANALTLRDDAYDTQAPDDWRRLLDTADQIVRLDPQNEEAQALRAEAQQAINTLENAAVLSVTPLLDLGTAPRPRRILVSDGWVYVLNTATDAVMALPLSEDRVSATAESPTTILRRGQTYFGEMVNHLVDFAWIPAGGSYPDGAVFIYSDGGAVFIYEPALGPGSITVQHIEGDLDAGNVTVMETFGEKFYLVNRQINQVLMYEPVNGIYENPRAYFAEGTVPDLQLVLDVAIDGRVYLLMGDGTIQTFFAGSYDHSFEMSGLPDANFEPRVMAIEPDPEDGLVYLAETQEERIIVLDKRGEFVRQYKLPKGELKRIEALTIDHEVGALYIVAENRLFAALLPNFETGSEP